MATSSLSTLVRVPGRLVINPSSLATTFPYGGTDAGAVDELALEVIRHTERITEEGFGVQVTLDRLDCGESWRMRCRLRGPAQGQIDKFFMAGSSSGILYPSSSAPGVMLGERNFKLLFVPRDAAKWAIYFKRCIASLDEGEEMPHDIRRDLAPRVLFEATPVDSGNAVQWQPIASVTL